MCIESNNSRKRIEWATNLLNASLREQQSSSVHILNFLISPGKYAKTLLFREQVIIYVVFGFSWRKCARVPRPRLKRKRKSENCRVRLLPDRFLIAAFALTHFSLMFLIKTQTLGEKMGRI